MEYKNGSSTEPKTPLKKDIYSLYQLFTIMKVANYWYQEFISSFDDHNNRNRNLTKVTSPVVENKCSYRRLNFYAKRDLKVPEAVNRREYMTFGLQGKDIRQHLKNVTPSAMSRIFKRLCLHRTIKQIKGTYKYFVTAYSKEIITAGLTF